MVTKTLGISGPTTQRENPIADELADLRARMAPHLRALGYGDIADQASQPLPEPAINSAGASHDPPEDYQRYLRRILWTRTIKPRVLERDANTCRRCCGRATLVHHRLYTDAVMRGDADEWLVSLCDGCHTVVHFDDRNSWRTWEDQEVVLATPDTDRGFPKPKIDLRRRGALVRPPNWGRMNSHQRTGWNEEARRQLAIKLGV